MCHRTFQWETADGTGLFGQAWLPHTPPWITLCLVHGIGEHSSRYSQWASRFVEEGVAIVSFDQRGHGLSQGKRGVITSYDTLLDDIDMVIAKARMLTPKIPVVLYGHSMGGGEVLNHVLRRKSSYDGVIATAPWLVSQASPPKAVVGLARFLCHLLPDMTTSSGLSTGSLSHESDVVNGYADDDLVHSRISLRLFVQAYDAGYWALQNAKALNKPVLLLHGDADAITSFQASRQFAQEAGQFCHFLACNKAYHELHNEEKDIQDYVFGNIITWLRENIAVMA